MAATEEKSISDVWPCCIVLAPWITPYGYEEQNLGLGATGPSWQHWIGTDTLGRDLFTRVLYGGRVSLTVGLIATGVALVVGVSWGAVAGYTGGRTDAIMMRLVDIIYALPRSVDGCIWAFVIFVVFSHWLGRMAHYGSHCSRSGAVDKTIGVC